MGEHKQGVPERAKKRKQKMLVYSIIGVLAVIAVIIAVMITSGHAENNDPGETTAATESTEPVVITPAKIGEISTDGVENIFDTETEQNEFHIGDVVKYGDAKIIFVSGEDVVIEKEADEEAYKLVTVKFAAENIGDAKLDISFYNFTGYVGDEIVTLDYSGEDYLDADLSTGRFTMGCLYFKVPVDTERLDIRYSDTKQTADAPVITFVYDGMNNSGYTGQSNITASENAISVGSVVEINNRKVTYTGCSEYVDPDADKQPQDGYRFVTLEFEVENLAESGKADITAWDFSCYADNMPCDNMHIRDDELEGLLPAGDSMTGTVTFEVPIDAEIIEAEYLYDYETWGRVIFSIECPIEHTN